MTKWSRLLLAASLCLLGLSGPAAAEEPERAPAAEVEGTAEPEKDREAPQEVVIYKPPPRGSPRGLRPGGTRSAIALPRPLVLAPNHLAHTLRAAPSLFFHLDGVPPEGAQLALTLIASDAIDPLLEVTLPRVTSAGIQRVRLADYDVELAPDVEYEWTVALQSGSQPGADDTLSQGYLLRVRPDPQAPRPETARDYAAQGLWYDALEVLSDAIDAGGGEAARRQRESLLRQASLEAALP